MKKIITIITILLSVNAYTQKLGTYDLKTNYFTNPVGIDNLNPRFSWKITPDSILKNITQTYYHIQVITDTSNINSSNIIWDTQKKNSEQSINIIYNGEKLSSKTRYFWRVKVWDNHQRESEWSPFTFFETALFDTTEWKAKWIEPNLPEVDKSNNPCPHVRKEFELKKEVKKARLYITSHGLYEAYINGEKVTNHLFTPGWTSYHKRLQYQVYDVTNLLKQGNNATGVILGDGWYKGRFVGRNRWNHYGTKIGLLYQLEVEYIDATSEIIVSDKAWKAAHGPIRISGIYDGELYDAAKELGKWAESGYNDKAWKKVIEKQHSLSNLIPNEGLPVKIIQELEVKRKIITPKNELVFDFGQLLTGIVQFKVSSKKGDTITIYHAEVLDKEGNFYTDNLRSAKQMVQYVFSDNSEVTYNPLFTFQGFRYIKIESPSGEIKPEDFKALVIHSEMTPTGNFHCSDSLVNQLYSNIVWSQKGNFLDIPTDCPQRDERLGWTGDAQVFSSTAIYNYDVAAFFIKWLNDLKADQLENGSVPYVIPDVKKKSGSTGWGDAATIVPYELYLKYGDKRFLVNQYESMKAWVGYLTELAGSDLIVDDGFHYGDWLFYIHPTNWNDKPGYTDKDLIATAFFAYSAVLCKNTAEILGFEDDADYFNHLYNNIKDVFQKEYLTSTGRLSSNSQTAYILALEFNLIPDSLKSNAVNYLVKNIESRKYHLSTGFLGTPYICKVLTENGFKNVAYKLLLQKDYPSWLYPISKGATTIWERWDGIKPDGSFQTTRMNSFNHYAYGAIGSWLYEYVAGIQTSKEAPGYKNIVIQPYVDTSLSHAKFSYESVYGLISSEWKIRDKKFHFSVIVPSNTKATIIFPFKKERCEVGSGKYVYEYDINPE